MYQVVYLWCHHADACAHPHACQSAYGDCWNSPISCPPRIKPVGNTCAAISNLKAVCNVLLTSKCCLAGPTAVIDQLFDAEQGRAVPSSPERTALIFPYKNQYVLFDGRLGHGVLGSSSKQPRVTMLINWWTEKPQVHSLLTTL